ncbi:LysR substrate-binding domain-containing protein [Blastochloris viridis]|uniref:Cyn operon transcriptional activator n=1 Tax=Blastochloris viridis TaxID=1079 RepID=A0A0H5BDC2_BLAVI|nr:LysR substrate-binding domain-containing protein [Blastochloris viridis]ALK09894.1 HTH-type transcriptional regulator CynR [Blastochloris viridis]BAS00201.1 transcriptional regulator [Blastochloris viridis]CUU42557.1 Cyn operon transcriptional activator [Blastochloris viridis]
MVDTRQLRYFISIVEQGSLSRAAETLHVAQPALSLHLKRMEEEFGCQLVLRTSRGVVPTESGQRLAQRAQEVLETIHRLADEVRGLEAVPTGPAVIGVPTSLGPILTVPLVKLVRERCPEVRLRVVEALSGHMQDWVLSGELDLAVVFGEAPPPGLSVRFLARESLCLVGPCDDALTRGRTEIDLDGVLDLPLILPGLPHGVRAEVERVAMRRRRPPNVIVELDSLDQIKTLVADGVGYTLLSPRYAGHGAIVTRLAIVPVVRPSVERTISLAHAASRPLSIAARAVNDLLLDLVARHTCDGRWV